jgi:hypothetical protein
MPPLGLFLFLPVLLSAQTTESVVFRAILLPDNEVPDVNSTAGAATGVR